MPTLNDTQSVLLATAAQRDGGSLYPLPETLTAGTRVSRAIAKLLSTASIVERDTRDASAVHRIDGSFRFGLFVTPSGLQAIGVEPIDSESDEAFPSTNIPALPAASSKTKAAQVVALLSRPDGATLPELIQATAWLPHTTRAALTGLRKKGRLIKRSKRADETCYQIAPVETG